MSEARTPLLGSEGILSVSATVEGTPTLSEVAAIRDFSINRSVETVDASAKDTFPVKVEIPTNNVIEVTFSLVCIKEHTTVRDILLDAIDATTMDTKRIYASVKDHANGRGYEGIWYVTQANETLPYTDVQTYQFTLKPASVLTVIKGDYTASSTSSSSSSSGT